MVSKIVIAGATGLIGSNCIKEAEPLLQNRDDAAILAITRRELPFDGADFTSQLLIDFEHLNACKTNLTGYSAICALGTTMKKAGSRKAFARVDELYVKRFADWCFKNGVRNFVLISSIAARAESLNYYLKTKGRAEEAVRTVGFERLTIIRPSVLIGDRGERRVLEQIGAAALQPLGLLMAGPLKSLRPVEGRTVARAALQACGGEAGVFIWQGAEIVNAARGLSAQAV